MCVFNYIWKVQILLQTSNLSLLFKPLIIDHIVR